MKFYFLTGIPRAGHTLFGSIMNQNPDIKVTANSTVMDIVRNVDKARYTDTFENFQDHKSLDNVIENIYPNYYKDWNCKYIIDRNYLGLNLNEASNGIELLKKAIKNEIKIIVLLRDILPVLQSIIKNARKILLFLRLAHLKIYITQAMLFRKTVRMNQFVQHWHQKMD